MTTPETRNHKGLRRRIRPHKHTPAETLVFDKLIAVCNNSTTIKKPPKNQEASSRGGSERRVPRFLRERSAFMHVGAQPRHRQVQSSFPPIVYIKVDSNASKVR